MRILVVAAGTLWLAACSDWTVNDSDAVATTDVVATSRAEVTEDSKPSETTQPTGTTVADITEIVHPPASGDFVGALEDVSDQTCEQVADGWQVTGTVLNPTEVAADYRIYISLLNEESVTRALVETELLAVGPQAQTTFDQSIAIPDDDLRCVLRVERRASGT